MAACSGNTGVFDCQVRVCKKFLKKLYEVEELRPLQNHDIPQKAKTFKPMYDITGFDAFKVVALLCRIVNDRKQFTTGKTFYLLIRNGQECEANDETEESSSSQESKQAGEIKELFQLEARPSDDQPGNGRVFRLPKGSASFARGKSYNELCRNLTQIDAEDTESRFASQIRNLFQCNTVVTNAFPETTDVYMLWLFEIARRLVNEKTPSERKKKLDNLPIGSAITNLVELLERKKCTFKDVFQGKYYCFTGEPDERRQVIDSINKTIFENPANIEYKQIYEELEKMFCSEETREEMLSKAFKNANLTDNQRSLGQ